MKRKLLFMAFCFATLAPAQTEYFPLHAGNQWIYRGGNQDLRVMEVAGTEKFDGKDYALLKGYFGGDAYLRMGDQGTLYAYDAEAKTERPWVAFATPEGGTFETALDPCNRQGVVRSVNARVSSPVGDITGAFEVGYPAANCADAGLDSDVYGKWIGLVRRTFVTIAGPRTYDLIYARIGGVTVLSEREVSVGLTLDQSVYTHGRQPAMLTARLSLRHSQPDPIEVVYASGQSYEFVIRNAAGDMVYRWSEGKAFTLALRQVKYPAGERNWVEAIRLADKDGKPFAAGQYTIEAWLVTTPVPKAWAASLPFEIR